MFTKYMVANKQERWKNLFYKVYSTVFTVISTINIDDKGSTAYQTSAGWQ
jgi:hypothetical protein